jgi:rRNA processing protein Krr1/Pno1
MVPALRRLSLPTLEESTMDGEIQLISDGDGLAVIGEPAAVERFLASERLPSQNLGLAPLKDVLGYGASAAQAGSEIAANSGRWVKLTEQSAHLVKQYGLMDSKTPGVSHAMVGQPGSIKSWIQIVKGPGSLATNPAILTGAAGMMAQLAMKQTMDEITDYLARIDEKLNDVLRGQEDAVLADMIGVGLDIDEAMTIREHGGRVNEVTWSKVQASSSTIARTQAYALRQLDALAEKLERKSNIGDLAETTKEAELKVQGWLVVLARCFQLQDAVAVLELDRVLDVAPDDLDGHRLGLKAVRQKRLDTISQTTERLMARMNAAAGLANSKVLLNPMQSPAVVRSREHVAVSVSDFHGRLGIESGRESLEARAWADAATEVKDKVFETGAAHVDASKRIGAEAFGRAKSVTGRFSSGIADRTLRRRGGDAERDDQAE